MIHTATVLPERCAVGSTNFINFTPATLGIHNKGPSHLRNDILSSKATSVMVVNAECIGALFGAELHIWHVDSHTDYRYGLDSPQAGFWLIVVTRRTEMAWSEGISAPSFFQYAPNDPPPIRSRMRDREKPADSTRASRSILDDEG